jgi:hypothetical protein
MLGWYQPLSTYHLPSAPILTVPIPNLPVSVAEKKKKKRAHDEIAESKEKKQQERKRRG